MISPAKIPDDELIDDLQKTAEQVNGVLTQSEYRGHGNYTPVVLQNRFGSWNKAKEAAGLDTLDAGELKIEKKKFKFSEDELQHFLHQFKQFRGWVPYQEVYDTVDGISHQRKLRAVVSQLQDQDNGLQIRAQCTKGGNRSRIYVQLKGEERFDEYKEQVPDRTEDVLMKCVGSGRSPKSAVAAINYLIDDDLTQKEAADDAEVTAFSLRKTRNFIEEEGLDDQLTKNNDATQVT